MRKVSAFLILSTLILPGVCAQSKTVEFNIQPAQTKISNSPYKTITYLDSRPDTASMGMVYLDHGFEDRRRKVVAKTPIGKQCETYLASLTDSTARDGRLLFQMRRFDFMQALGGTSAKRHCFLRAGIYAENEGRYRRLAFIDTTITTTGANGTRKMFNETSLVLQEFINAGINNNIPETVSYSFYDISRIDSIEKRSMAVYNTTQYADGAYFSYHAFVSQVPDKKISAKIKNGELEAVKSIDDNGSEQSMKAKDVYAVVYNTRPYISTKYGYYPLKLVDDEFVFTGKAKAAPNNGDVMAATLAFGIVGGILASNVTGTFEMKIDYVNGQVIVLRQVADDKK